MGNTLGQTVDVSNIEYGLTRAVNDGNIEHMKLLLDHGVDPANPKCENALILAAIRGHKDIVRMLLDHGTSCNIAKSDGKTPLVLAAENGFTHIVKMLLLHSRISEYKKSLIMATGRGHTDIVRMLLDHGTSCNIAKSDSKTPLILAAENGYTHIVKMLLDCGALYHTKHSECKTALHCVTKRGDIDILKMLINNDIDYNTEKSKDHLLTPLMWATYRGYTDIVMSLLEHGSDCNGINSNGKTPLLIAIESGYTDVVTPFLEHGADCNRVNLYGETPLIQALKRHNIHIDKKLLHCGSCCTVVNPFAYRAVQIAARRGQIDDIFHVIRMMLAYDRSIKDIDGYESLRHCLRLRYHRLPIHDILRLINLMYWSGMCHQSHLFQILHDSDIMETLTEDPDIIKWLKEKCESPMTLKNITRIIIYKNIQINRDDNIHKLPIPSQLKNFLLFPNLGDDKVEFLSHQ